MRLKAPGAKPGRVGRCPECGRRLQVPGEAQPFRLRPDSEEPAKASSGGNREPVTPASRDQAQPFRLKPDDVSSSTRKIAGASEALWIDDLSEPHPFQLGPDSDKPRAAAPESTDDHTPSVYQLLPEAVPVVVREERTPAIKDIATYVKARESSDTGPMADGFLPVLKQPELNWFASFLYPLRSFECLSVIAILSGILWVFLTLVPEYCLSVMGDADSMGVSTMGKFVALISIIPVMFLLPFVLFYWLQYLARVLVFSAMGDTMPPRTPDRNFEGFFSGLSPWFVWLALGVSVGLLPLFGYGLYQNSAAGALSWPMAVLLVGLGFPYIVMALLMSFLHDHALAANPFNVLGAMLRVGASFLLVCLFAVGAVGLGAAAFAVVLLLRADQFFIYLAFCLAAWVVFTWCSIVIMRVLGTYYYFRRDSLQWHHERPRWGVAWKV
jgi:hypothetical protein